MCGIAGAVGQLDPEVSAAVRSSGMSQAHRGPDSGGFWSSLRAEAGSGAAFAHRRLAIIDLSPRGRQPMLDPDTGNVLCFNGEIYNFKALRNELKREGASFRTSTDSEVILQAYAAWGQRCVTRLRGMFAFALWDAAQRCVLLARDRIGIKPLYLAEVRRPGGRRAVLFASELRALLAGGLLERRLSPTGLSTYLWNGFVTAPETIVSGVWSLDAGHTAWISQGGEILRAERFWRLPSAAGGSGDSETLAHALQQAVELRLISDVPLGIFLSGGVDSSAVAALAARTSSTRIRTFNISFDEAGYDESCYATAVAKGLGTDHHEIRLTQERFQSQLEEALASLDQPTFDGINTYFISRAVREAGITVALSGAGGDELFGGYRSFLDIPRAALWARRLGPLPVGLVRALAAAVARFKTGRAGGVPPQTRWGKLGDALATRGRLVELYQTSYSLFSSNFIDELRCVPEPEGVGHGLSQVRLRELEALTRSGPELHSISMLELSCFIGDRLLRDTDTTSMAVSLEVRVPLLDHQVIEAAAALGEAQRYAPLGSKSVLREIALADLDPAIFDRPKAGFVLPIELWSRASLKGEIDSTFEDRARCESVGLNPNAIARLWRAYQAGAPGIYWSRIWALFVLLHWTHAHRVSL